MTARTFHQDLIRTIFKSKMRFLSILAIIALGVGFFAGIKATEPDMRLSADAYYQETRLSDFQIISPLGFRDKDLDALQALDGIESIQPGYRADLFVYSDSGNRYSVRLMSVGRDVWESESGLNKPQINEGRIPQQSGEIVFESGINVPEDIKIGSLVQFTSPGDQQLLDTLKRSDFTVVGYLTSPLYINFERGQTAIGDGSIDFYGYVLDLDFNQERYAEIYLRTEASNNLQAYTETYDKHLEPFKERLIELGQSALQDETDTYRQELNEQKNEWQRNKDDVEREIREASIKLKEARLELESAEQSLNEEEERYRTELDQNEQALRDGRDDYNAGLMTYYDSYTVWLEAYNTYQDGRSALNESKQQLDQGRNELDAAKQQLDSAKADLDQAATQLTLLKDAINQLTEVRSSLPADGAVLSDEALENIISVIRPYSEELAVYLESNRDNPDLIRQLRISLDSIITNLQQNLDDGQAAYDKGLGEYTTGLAAWQRQDETWQTGLRDYEEGAAELDAAKTDIDAGKAELDDAKAKLDATRIKLEASERALTAGRTAFEQRVADGRTEIAAGKKELADNQQKLDEESELAQTKINEAQTQIREAERQILELPDEWILLTRNDQPGYSDFGDDARRIGTVATIFPLFFFLIAALVCLTTMTRMVEEERMQIGTLKALGYSSRQIAAKYLLYALAASLTGSVMGVLLGFQIFPISIMNAYGLLYNIPNWVSPFHWSYAIIATLLAVATTLLVTYLTVLGELRETPAHLMQVRAPKPGKRILLEYIKPFWQRLSFMQKLTARNLFRYKQRFFMTVIGIAGCTALLLTGFGLKDSVNAIIGNQFESIFVFDGQVMIDPDDDPNQTALDHVVQAHTEISASMKLATEAVTVESLQAEKGYDANLIIPETPEMLGRFYQLRDRKTGQSIPLQPQGAVITEKLAELLQVKTGDSLTIRDTENRTYTLFITGVAEQYLSHYIYMSADYFDQLTLRKPVYNALVFNLDEEQSVDTQRFQESLLESDSVLGSFMTLNISDDFARSIRSLNYVVILLILSAGALAFVVMYNLTSINIAERIREIATIKVLGFRDREVSDYVFKENLILTGIGMAVGLLLGVSLHRFVMGTMETDVLMFGRQIDWLSYLLSGLLTFVFSIFVNILMHFRLRRVELVESLKSVE